MDLGSIMFLHCDGYKKKSSQPDCRTYFDNGTLTFVNRYSIREWSQNAVDNALSFNDSKVFEKFVQIINNQMNYNKNGVITGVPIIAYHGIDNNKTRSKD